MRRTGFLIVLLSCVLCLCLLSTTTTVISVLLSFLPLDAPSSSSLPLFLTILLYLCFSSTYLINWTISVRGFHVNGSMRDELSPENTKQSKSLEISSNANILQELFIVLSGAPNTQSARQTPKFCFLVEHVAAYATFRSIGSPRWNIDSESSLHPTSPSSSTQTPFPSREKSVVFA
jgi:hypothetical protein